MVVGPLLVRCLLLALTADPLEVQAGVASETRAGVMPLYANQPSTGFVAQVVTPEAGLELREPNTTLRLRFYPRVYWQSSEGADGSGTAGQPPAGSSGSSGSLWMLQSSLTLATKVTATTRFTAQATAAYGKPDYAALPQLLPTGQAVLPNVQEVFSATGNAGVEADLSRRWQLFMTAYGSRFQPLGTTAPVDPAMPTIVPLPSTTLSAVPGVLFEATHVDGFALTVSTTYATFATASTATTMTTSPADSDAQILILNPMLTWRRRLAADTALHVGGGVAHARDLGARDVTNGQADFMPTAQAELISRLANVEQSTLQADLRAVVDDYIDPILAISGPRLLTTARLNLMTSTDWTAGLQADFSKAWASAPEVMTAPGMTLPATTPLDLMSLAVTVPVRYRVSSHFAVEGGGRYFDRGPSFSGFHQRALWAYVALTVTTHNEAPPTHRTAP